MPVTPNVQGTGTEIRHFVQNDRGGANEKSPRPGLFVHVR
jgi:hypothetical protein